MAQISQTPEKTYLRRHRQLAPTASIRVSPLCLGAMCFGTAQPERYGECSKEDAFGVLDMFYSHGGNFIDTANGYQLGQSEQWLGEWMVSRNVRDDIVLATKYSGSIKMAKSNLQSNYGGNNTKSMRLSVENSLKQLQTGYIDLFYVHWWDYATTIPELMHALNDLVSSGKVNYLGISDAPAWVVSKANQYARDHGLRQFVVYQGMWSAAKRDFERDIIPMCHDEGMGLCPYGVLGGGKFQTEEGFKAREKHNPGRNFIPVNEHDKKISRVLENISNRKNTTITNVALAYVRQKAPYVFPIVGVRKVGHIKGNIEGLSVSLTENEMKEVEEAYPFDYGFPHDFLSGSLLGSGPSRGASGPEDIWLLRWLGDFDWVERPKPIKSSWDEEPKTIKVSGV